MTSREAIEGICVLLRRFISGHDRSLRFAGDLEGAIAAAFPEERFEDLLHALASYRPGVGPFLDDEEALAVKCQAALSELESTISQAT